MGKFIEPLIVRGINKDVSPGALDYSGRRILNPVRDVLNARYLTSEGDDAGKVENIKGTEEVIPASSLPLGINEVIGAYENVEKNLLIYFLWNSNGYSGILKYDGSANEINQILTDSPDNPVLKFKRNKLITGIGMIGDMLLWTDNNERQCCINTTRTYGTLNENLISLAKIGPKKAPIFLGFGTRVTDNTVSFNKLASDSFQFAFQYVYKDNELSVLSPYSKLDPGDISPKVMSSERAKIRVDHMIDTNVITLIKEVRLLYRKNNEPNWYVWKRVTNFSFTISEYFFNNEQGTVVPETQATKLFDLVPNRSKALAIFRGRVFLNIDEEGYDFVPPNISVERSALPGSPIGGLQSSDINAENTQSRGAFFKKDGNYSVVLFFRDKFGRLTGGVSKTDFNGEKLNITGSFKLNENPHSLDSFNRSAYKIDINLSGVGIPNTEYFIALSREKYYQQYMQVPAHMMWYYFSNDNDTMSSSLITKVQNTDRWYLKNEPGGSGTVKYWKYIHFLLPREVPFIPDKDCYVRFVSSGFVSKIEKVVDVLDGDILVTSDFGIGNEWSVAPTGVLGIPFLEIFKPNNVFDPFFYAVKGPYQTDENGNLQTTIIEDVDGDTFYFWPKSFNFRWYHSESTLFSQPIGGGVRHTLKSYITPWVFIESTSPIAKFDVASSIENTDILTQDRHDGLTPDLNKSAWSHGWPIVEAKPVLLSKPATLRFSDPYIEGSEINGLNSFPVGNIYDKIGQDRGPITKLIPVGNILVAVHERHLTSMYIGESIIRSGETGFIAKVDDVVGDDRKLIGDMGAYHAESVQSVDGQAFGYDIYTGVVWRYTVEGVIAISNFGMMNYFKERSDKYFPYRDELKFVSAIDRYNKEYLITLPHLFLNKQTASLQSINSASFQYDFVLNPAEYTNGKYRLKIVCYNQSSGTSAHRVNINVFFDDNMSQRIGPIDIKPNINTHSEQGTEAVYIEFDYSGEGFISIIFSDVFNPIFALISTEYQELVGETWAYNYMEKQWSHRCEIVPGFMGNVGNQVIGFKGGSVYKLFESNTYNNFFGIQYKRKIEIEANPIPGKVKTWSAVQVTSDTLMDDDAGSEKVIEVNNDQGQASYTRAKEFDKKEGVYYGPILKDVNTNPLLLPMGSIALRDGKDMRSKTLKVIIHNDSSEAARMQKINIVGEFSEFSI